MARIIRNLAELRAKRALNAPVIVAPDGREFLIGALSVDAYLAVLDLEEQFSALRAAEKAQGVQPDSQRALFAAAKDMILQFLPGFPVGDLDLEELFLVLSDVQTAHTPEPPQAATAEEGAGEAPLGE